MLTICVGPNGSGKSLWAMFQLVWYLIHDHRPIVTSLAVDIPALNEYLQRLYGDKAPDVTKRVVLITKDQMRSFWRVRGPGEWDPYYGQMPKVRGPYGDKTWQERDSGVIYILEETQTVYGAREWQKTGPEFVTYQSQHRHHGDDVIAITPASSLLDKQFRLLCGECVALTNLYKLKVGWIKAPRKIVYRVYANCPPLPGEAHLSKGDLHIDAAGLAGCYRTQDSVEGIGGRDADKGKESNGVPYWAIFPAVLIGCFCAWLGLKAIMSTGSRAATSALQVAAPPPPSSAAPPVQAAPVQAAAPNIPPRTNSVYCVGYGPETAFLSDGSEVRRPLWRPLDRSTVIVLGIGVIPVKGGEPRIDDGVLQQFRIHANQ